MPRKSFALLAATLALALVAGLASPDDRWDADVAVEIAAPLDAVWRYVGDSERAGEWSVYFDHIRPLPGVPDGRVGALRACFRRADETGVAWDERVTSLDARGPVRSRALQTFRIRGLGGVRGWLAARTAHRVEQRYAALPGGRTRLTFRTRAETGWLRPFARVYAGDVDHVFRQNLANIRAAVEAEHAGLQPRRPFAYAAVHTWDR